MRTDATLSHEQLLTLANKTCAAALDHDTDRLEAAALRFVRAVAEHLRAERSALLHVSPTQARILVRGQQQLLADLTELVDCVTVAASRPGRCDCVRLAERVVAELTLQADAERRYFAATVDR